MTARTDEDVKAAITKAIKNGAPTIYDISIATGVEYAQVVRVVLKGLASHTYRLAVNERDGVPDKSVGDCGAKPAG
jgi:hypothetical protein